MIRPTVVPVVEVGRGVAAHAPVPDAAAGRRVLLVLAVPVERAVLVVHRAAVGLDAVAVGVEPRPGRGGWRRCSCLGVGRLGVRTSDLGSASAMFKGMQTRVLAQAGQRTLTRFRNGSSLESLGSSSVTSTSTRSHAKPWAGARWPIWTRRPQGSPRGGAGERDLHLRLLERGLARPDSGSTAAALTNRRRRAGRAPHEPPAGRRGCRCGGRARRP